jgi:hypothetical protein
MFFAKILFLFAFSSVLAVSFETDCKLSNEFPELPTALNMMTLSITCGETSQNLCLEGIVKTVEGSSTEIDFVPSIAVLHDASKCPSKEEMQEVIGVAILRFLRHLVWMRRVYQF